MAKSPAHRFGQIIGDLLEEIMQPELQAFCDGCGFYLDKKGPRSGVRSGKKVTWEDRYGNSHDLDFVIEKGGSDQQRGKPVAFIETAWRRYTKHSRNKAQEIQGALLPIAEQHAWDRPFLGAVLAGVFTEPSIAQMRSSGFEVILFPYESILFAFASVGIEAAFDEATPDPEFTRIIEQIGRLSGHQWASLKSRLIEGNRGRLDDFLRILQRKLDRQVDCILVTPLHGTRSEFPSIGEAVDFVTGYDEGTGHGGAFREYEISLRFSNGEG